MVDISVRSIANRRIYIMYTMNCCSGIALPRQFEL